MSVVNPTLTPMSNPRVIIESVGTTMTPHLEAHLSMRVAPVPSSAAFSKRSQNRKKGSAKVV